MHHFKTEAIILNKLDVFDSDRSYLLFTRNLGKIRARAKGVRKPSSKLSGHLLLFSPTQIELVQKGEYYLITSAQSLALDNDIDYFDRAIEFIQGAEVIAEALASLYEDGISFPYIYDSLKYTIDRLKAVGGGGVRWLIMAEFLEKSLVSLGLKPVLDCCLVGGQSLKEQDELIWSSSLGGVISCVEGGSIAEAGDKISIKNNRTIILLRQFAREDFVAEKILVNEEIQKEALALIMNFVQTQIGRPLRAYQIGFGLL